MSGKQVRLYLVDGTPGGLLTAEIMNWTGHIIAAPRSDLAALLKREEAHRTGVYVLLGDDPDSVSESAVYVGEGDEISTRLKQHAGAADSRGKDFWDRVIILTSKDAHLTKAHARYLESRLIALAANAKRARLINATAPAPLMLPEADVADMEYYLQQVQIVLPVLGTSVFRPAGNSAGTVTGSSAALPAGHQSPVFTLELARHGVKATAQEIDGEFTVFAGSLARAAWIGTNRHPGYERLHASFVADGTLRPTASDLAEFTRNVVFSSPSAAAAVTTGRAANGRTAWIEEQSGLLFGDWQDRGVE